MAGRLSSLRKSRVFQPARKKQIEKLTACTPNNQILSRRPGAEQRLPCFIRRKGELKSDVRIGFVLSNPPGLRFRESSRRVDGCSVPRGQITRRHRGSN